MKTIIAFLLLTAGVIAHALTPVQQLARAIAKAEGFGIRGSVPTRTHNPGDIRASRSVHYPGQVGMNTRGYVIFKNDRAGWDALYNQLDKIAAGESHYYSVNMTLRQLSCKYATSPLWVNNVAKNLGVTPNTALFEVLDVPPVITMKEKPHALDFLGGDVK